MWNIKEVWRLFKMAVTAWSNDYAPSMGAALSYYTLFSIAPLLLIVIAVAGWFFGDDAARGEITSGLQGLMGEEGAKAVEDMVGRCATGPRLARVEAVERVLETAGPFPRRARRSRASPTLRQRGTASAIARWPPSR